MNVGRVVYPLTVLPNKQTKENLTLYCDTFLTIYLLFSQSVTWYYVYYTVHLQHEIET